MEDISFNKTEDIVPIAWGTLEGDKFTITKCPICGEKHEHTGNTKYGAYQGLRIPHCSGNKMKYKRYALIAEGLVAVDLFESNIEFE